MVGGARALDEQRDRAAMQVERIAVERQSQRLDAHKLLARHAQRELTRHQDVLRRRGVEHLRHEAGDSLDHVLRVVEHEQPALECAQDGRQQMSSGRSTLSARAAAASTCPA